MSAGDRAAREPGCRPAMIFRLIPATTILLLASVPEAAAHSPIKGIGAFYNGLLHPVLILPHLLALAAVGLLIGQNAPRTSRIVLPIVTACLVCGLAFGIGRLAAPPQWALLAVGLASGLLVAVAWPGGILLPGALAIVAAALVALDSPPDTTRADQMRLMLAGNGLGAILVVTYCGGIAALVRKPWQRIGVRVAGSWIAAIALLALALDRVSAWSPPA